MIVSCHCFKIDFFFIYIFLLGLSYDIHLESPHRPTQSRSVFHVSSSADLPSHALSNPNKQYGVPLADLVKRDGVEIPRVVEKCVCFLEQNGLEVEGIFRRTPNNVRLHATKKQVDMGEFCGCGKGVGVREEHGRYCIVRNMVSCERFKRIRLRVGDFCDK